MRLMLRPFVLTSIAGGRNNVHTMGANSQFHDALLSGDPPHALELDIIYQLHPKLKKYLNSVIQNNELSSFSIDILVEIIMVFGLDEADHLQNTIRTSQ